MSDANSSPPIIVYGRDDKRRPRGAAFDASRSDEVGQRATQLRLAFVQADTPALREIAGTLPRGDLTQAGIGFAPVIAVAMLDKLLAVIEPPSKTRPSAHRTPADWESIAVGDLVLVPDEPGEGWFEAIVVEKLAEHMFRLKYRDYADWPEMTFGRHQLGLLPPSP